MAGAGTRPCANCKKDIPEDNYTLHFVYCNRNLRICQQCKEPIAISDMEKHTAQVSCNLCGENMQACDLPAHKTDACSLTQIPCQYCELMLERRNMADHETYCGTRTEQCTECSELVMFKYKKLHEDSNHSFLKLDDEPGPLPSWKVKQEKTKKKPTFNSEAMQNFFTDDRFNGAYQERCKNDNVKNFKSVNKPKVSKESLPFASTPPFQNSQPISKSDHTNGPQLPSTSRGAIKKRIAPLPPADQNTNQNVDKNVAVLKPFTHVRDVPMYHAMAREQAQTKKREAQNKYNIENGLPPVLTTAEKVEKLQKMSDLQNFDYEEYSRNSTKPIERNKGHKSKENSVADENITQNGYLDMPKRDVGGSSTSKNVNVKTDKNNKKKYEYIEFSPENVRFIPSDLLPNRNELPMQTSRLFAPLSENHRNLPRSSIVNPENEITENDLRPVNRSGKKRERRPHFIDIIEPIIEAENPSNYNSPNSVDRFSDIKNSLTALRKEFKNCTSPYETKNLTARKEDKIFTKAIAPKNDNMDRDDDYNPVDLYRISNDIPADLIDVQHHEDGLKDVMLPCEFCEEMIQASDLVVHETGCRPNLTSFSEQCLPKPSQIFVPPNSPDVQYTPKIPNVHTNAMQQNALVNIPIKTSPRNGKKEKSNKNNTVLLPNDAVGEVDEVKLPCEFCMVLVPACRLQWHQRNCFAEMSSL